MERELVGETNSLVSIVVPLYNGEDFIKSTIYTVFKQTYRNWELVIVDDCSTDNSYKIVNDLARGDSRIRLFKQSSNQGAANARNRAVKESRGKYIAFLDSDDIWNKDKLEKQLNFMEKYNYPITCTYYGKINEDGKNLNHTMKSPQKISYNYLLTHGIGNSTVIYDQEYVGKTYIPNIRKRNDYLMWLKIIKKTEYIHCLPKELAFHRLRENSISSKKLGLVKYQWRIYRKYERLSVIKSLFIMMIIVTNSLITKISLYGRY